MTLSPGEEVFELGFRLLLDGISSSGRKLGCPMENASFLLQFCLLALLQLGGAGGSTYSANSSGLAQLAAVGLGFMSTLPSHKNMPCR